MRRYTSRYNAARKAGAKPILIAFVSSDRATRCVGKETPTELLAGTGTGVFERRAGVISFGDFRQSLASQNDNILLAFQEQELSSYTLTCDNADKYFTRLFGREEFLGGDLELYQGFEYPGFTKTDCQLLFKGQITSYYIQDSITAVLTADYALDQQDTDSLTLETGVTFGVENGDGEPVPPDDLEEWFYTDQPWEITLDYTRPGGSPDQKLFSVDNDNGEVRIEMGVGTDDYFYIDYKINVNDTTTDAVTVKNDFIISAAVHTTTVEYDGEGNFVITDGASSTSISSLHLVYQIPSVGTAGSGISDAIIVGGTAVYACDYLGHRIAIFSAYAGEPVTYYGSLGTGLGQFVQPIALAASGIPFAIGPAADDQVCVVDRGNYRVQIFYPRIGSWSNKVFGSSGTGDGQFSFGMNNICVDDDLAIYVSDNLLERIQKFIPVDTGGPGGESYEYQFSLKWGSAGTGDGQFSTVSCVKFYEGYIWAGDLTTRLQKFDKSGNHIQTYTFSHSTTYFNFDSAGNLLGKLLMMGFPSATLNEYDSNFVLVQEYDISDERLSTGNGFAFLDNGNFWKSGEAPGGSSPTEMGFYSRQPKYVDTVNYVENQSNTSIDAFETFVPPTTDDYSNPGNNQKNVSLPLPYGTLTENSDGAVWVAPLIDDVNYVYAVAGWPIQSVANGNTVTVYANGVSVVSGWTFDESNDYEGKGNIAIITFSSTQGDAVITVKCNGKWVDGELLTNPVDIIEDLMGYVATRAGVTGWKRDTNNFAYWKAFCSTSSYDCAGVIIQNNSLAFLMKEILQSFAGTFFFSRDGLVRLQFMELSTSEDAYEEVFEYENIGLKISKDTENICHRVIVNYAVSYVTIDRRFSEGASVSHYRTADETYLGASTLPYTGKTWTLNFNWTRDDYTVTQIITRIFELYGEPDWLVEYTGQDFKYLPLDLLDQVEGTFDCIVDADGDVVQRKVFEIRGKQINLDDFTTQLTLKGLGNVSLDDGVFFGESPVYFGSLRLRYATA